MSHPEFTFTLPAPAEPMLPAPRSPRRVNKPLWLIAIGLLANAAILLFHGKAPDIILDRSAFAQAIAPAQTTQLLGARGIYMMPAQLGPQTFGLYLLDVDSGTIALYRASPESNRFGLMAARSYKYDRFLEDFNNNTPRPKEVQKLVEDQRARLELQSKEGQPTVDQTPKPDENAPDKPANTEPPK